MKHSALCLAALLAATACRRGASGNASAPGSPVSPAAAPAAAPVAAPPPAPAVAGPPAAPSVPAQATGGSPAPGFSLTPQAVGSLTISSGGATVFRSAEGFWVLRVYFSVRNNGAAPVDVDRAHFKVQDLDQRDDFGTFAAHTGLNPAQTVEGDMAWWLPGTERQPANLQVRYRPGEGDNPPTLWERSFNLAFSPAQPAHGHAPSRPVYNLPVTVVAGSGRTWARPDQPRRVFAQVTVQNTLDVPLAIQRDMFRLALTPGDVQGFEAPEGAALAETVELAPGASVTGGIGYLFTNSAAAPTAATFTFGAANSPQVTAQVPLTAVPAPAE